jgi:histidine triad (HIT) family protein
MGVISVGVLGARGLVEAETYSTERGTARHGRITAVTDCLFCRIVSGEIPADVVAQNDHAMAFRDLNPQAPVHVLVIPREHHIDVGAMASADSELAGQVLALATQVAEQEGLAEGYRLVFNTGASAGQSVFHVHAHLLGGRNLTWPPG